MGDKVYLGNDTAGYYLKSKCIEYLEGKGIPSTYNVPERGKEERCKDY